MQTPATLTLTQCFARGGNRLCYVDPRDSRRCIKVIAPERTPEIRRHQQTFPKSLRPLTAFDDNLDEYRVFRKIDKLAGDAAYQLIPRCFGFVDTDQGRGLCSDLIRDESGLISISLKQYIWQNGVSGQLRASLEIFSEKWKALSMPSRGLLLHNIVVEQSNTGIQRLVVIDGLGWPDFFPLAYHCPTLARRKAAKRVTALDSAIDHLLSKREQDADYGYHGWLEEEQRKLV